jgi:AcrR family transcriptional regulator
MTLKTSGPRAPGAGATARGRSVGLLWQGKERPGRGPKPSLSLDAVVQGAIDVADREGLQAVTMNHVAARLGVTTMALYRYVPGKEELVDLMIDAAAGAPRPGRGLDWRIDLAQWARDNLAVLARHPWLLESTTRRVPIGPNWMGWLEAALQALADLDLSAKEMMAVVILVDGHVRGTAQTSLGVTGKEEWAARFRDVLELTSDDVRFPALRAVVTRGGFAGGRDDPRRQFEFGLQRVLDGVEAFVRARTRRRRKRKAPASHARPAPA